MASTLAGKGSALCAGLGLILISACSAVQPVDPPQTAPPEAAVKQLHALFDSEWERSLRENPLGATALGDTRYNDRWPDESTGMIEQMHAEDLTAQAQLDAIDTTSLPAAEQLNATLFRRQLDDSIQGDRFHPYLMPIDHIYGLQSAQDSVLEVASFNSEKDYRDWISRLRTFGTYADQTIALMKQGEAERRIPACAILQKIPAQIAKQRVASATESPFYAPFKQYPAAIPADVQASLTRDAATAIQTIVLPAYERFDTFFTSEYLPACRQDVGVSALPDGAAYYAYLARHHTTTELTPDQIHALGLAEVKRIRTSMDELRAQLGFKGSFEDFSRFLRTDPRFYFQSGDELFTAYAALCKRIDGQLPLLFSKLPRLPYGVRPVPMETAPYQTTAYYQPGAPDGSRAGFFYTNLYKPETRPKWEMEVLTSHEAVPGHHLQISLGQELGDLPQFRRNGSYTAFVEGWALYSESLGYDLGLYKDPYSRYGQLTYEMWRACRLVVDTGMHSMGWTRQQAIDFMASNMPRTRHDIEVEVDRYIAWPGQALAYKIGQIRITQLRANAQAQLGAQFDIRAFHEVVLGSGALPLDVLESNVNAWIASQKNKG